MLVISSVRLFVSSWCCIETTKQIELVFGTEAFLGLSYTVLERNLGYLQNKDTSLWNFDTNAGIR